MNTNNESPTHNTWFVPIAQIVGLVLGVAIGGVLAGAIGLLILVHELGPGAGDRAIGAGVFALIPIPFGAILGAYLGFWAGGTLAQKYQRGAREK